MDTSLGSLNSIYYSNGKYDWLSQESNLEKKPAPSFPPEDFDNCLSGWDDPPDSALSPPVESPSTTPRLRPLTPDMDAAELHVMSSISPSTPIDLATTISNGLGDNSIAFEDPITDELLFQSPQILPEITDVPPREGLYSTPLSWERPQLSYRVSNRNFYAPLSAAEESRLRSIAMPAQPYPVSPASSSSPEPQDTHNRRKRRSSKSPELDCPPLQRSRNSTPKKTAHNMTEKRYRTNINDNIAALRDSVPSLRVVARKNSRGENLQEDLQGLSPANKLSKVFIHSHFPSSFSPSCLLSVAFQMRLFRTDGLR
jgi:hypothetical protein